MKKCKFSVCFTFILLLFVHLLPAKEQTVPVTRWLTLGPVELHLPAFNQVPNLQGKTFGPKDLLKFSFIEFNRLRPKVGGAILWASDQTLIWQKRASADSGHAVLLPESNRKRQLYYLAFYLHVKRFMRPKIEVKAPHPFQVFVDGRPVLTQSISAVADSLNKPQMFFKTSTPFELETGTHCILIKTISDPAKTYQWSVAARILLPEYAQENDITLNISPQETMRVTHLLDGPKIRSVAVSPDGQYCVLAYGKSLPPSDKEERWLELRRLKNGRLVQSSRGLSKVRSVKWAPTGQRFAFTTNEKEKSTLWVADLQTGTTTALLKDVKQLGGYTWSPDGSFLIYSISEEPAKNKTGLKHVLALEDRWPWWRTRSFLYKVNFPSGTKVRLTAGKLSTNLNSISPDGQRLIFTRTLSDYSERPYSRTQYFILNLNDFSVDSLWTLKWAGSAQWSPNGRYLLVTGGPSIFNGLGSNLPKNVIPNDYDTQAYLYDFRSKSVQPVTKTFKPSINRAVWGSRARHIYFITTDRDYVNLYDYDLKKKTFKKIDTGGEVVHAFSKAAHQPLAAAIVSGASLPPRVMVINLKKKTHRLLLRPEEQTYANVRFGKVERWTFINKRHTEIEGRIYYPPDFSPDRRYPCIVYYYGGTTPVSRDFGGRYPKELWAANGYVVYVLQPSGATGFGQAFSALHVNDWGKIVADEIIDGTKKFLAAHPFVDSTKVGCIGASYGGFMTMTLVSKTHLFAAAVAHAGISLIPSYWGQGYWGYLYSAIATANSFPWNRRDIYVDRSPLFNADKIDTPLLLLHGTADTNVPTGESVQLYTALKLLGKTVELVEIKGQNHHIMAYSKRKRWTRTIIAWFDRWLKDQPQWWDALYPEK